MTSTSRDSASRETKVFEHRSVVKTTVAQMTAFHDNPLALRRLTPPPIVMQKLRDDRKSLTEGELEFRLWLGPIPVRWVARHEPGPSETSFVDLMLYGPMAYWRHEHIFRPVEDGVELIDSIRLAHKPGLAGFITRLFFDGVPLRLLFIYRHLRTRIALRETRED